MKKLITMILTLIMLVTTNLTVFAEQPDKAPAIPSKPSSGQGTTSGTADATVPSSVKPIKSYTVAVGKAYKLPEAVKKTSDSYASSNSAVLMVEKTTGRFTGVANGTAYIVITNASEKKYIKITVGNGGATSTPTKPTTSRKGVLTGYTVTVTDQSTIAVNSAGYMENGVFRIYFISSSGARLGSISQETHAKISQAVVYNGTVSLETKDIRVWFAEQFNLYRGLRADVQKMNSDQQAATVEEFRQEVIRLTNDARKKQGLPVLDVDSEAMAYAQIRAQELYTSYSHTRPNGELSSMEGYGTLENIAKGDVSAEDVVSRWLQSDGHRGNILSSESYAIGVGVYQSPNGSYHWVQIFVW